MSVKRFEQAVMPVTRFAQQVGLAVPVHAGVQVGPALDPPELEPPLLEPELEVEPPEVDPLLEPELLP